MSKTKQGIDPKQRILLPECLDDTVRKDALVRRIKDFVDIQSRKIAPLLYRRGTSLKGGQPPYDALMLLSVWIYAYMNRIQSSRVLSEHFHINKELEWLSGSQHPSHATLSNFRKDNTAVFQLVLKEFICLCTYGRLLDTEKLRVAVDGTKLRGNVSKRSIQSRRRLECEVKRLEEKIARYEREVEAADAREERDEDDGSGLSLSAAEWSRVCQSLREKQSQLSQLEASGEAQLGTTDKDARLMKGNGETKAGYNGQVAVETKSRLIVAATVTNEGNDIYQLSPMSEAVLHNTGVRRAQVMADKGYSNGAQMAQCEEMGVEPYVIQGKGSRKSKGYAQEAFAWDAEKEEFTCPAGEKSLYVGQRQLHGKQTHLYRFSPAVCSNCRKRKECIPGVKVKSRTLCRSVHAAARDRNKQRMTSEAGKKSIGERAGTVEPVIGTIQSYAYRGRHFLLRGLEKVKGEFSLQCLCYNLKRATKLLGSEGFRSLCEEYQGVSG